MRYQTRVILTLAAFGLWLGFSQIAEGARRSGARGTTARSASRSFGAGSAVVNGRRYTRHQLNVRASMARAARTDAHRRQQSFGSYGSRFTPSSFGLDSTRSLRRSGSFGSFRRSGSFGSLTRSRSSSSGLSSRSTSRDSRSASRGRSDRDGRHDVRRHHRSGRHGSRHRTVIVTYPRYYYPDNYSRSRSYPVYVEVPRYVPVPVPVAPPPERVTPPPPPPTPTEPVRQADPYEVYMREGHRAFYERQYSQAAGQFVHVVLAKPNDPIPKLAYGLAMFARGDYPTAAMAVKRGLERWPNAPQSLLDLRVAYASPVELARQLEGLMTYMRTHTNDPDLWLLAGYVHYFSGRRGESALHFQRVLVLRPGDPIAMRFLGLVQRGSPQVPAARSVPPSAAPTVTPPPARAY